MNHASLVVKQLCILRLPSRSRKCTIFGLLPTVSIIKNKFKKILNTVK